MSADGAQQHAWLHGVRPSVCWFPAAPLLQAARLYAGLLEFGYFAAALVRLRLVYQPHCTHTLCSWHLHWHPPIRLHAQEPYTNTTCMKRMHMLDFSCHSAPSASSRVCTNPSSASGSSHSGCVGRDSQLTTAAAAKVEVTVGGCALGQARLPFTTHSLLCHTKH